MKMTRVANVLILALALVSSSYAGNESGGGGSGIVCFKSSEAANEVRANGGIVPDKLINQIGALQSLDLQLAFMRKNFDGTSREVFLAKKGQSFNDYFNELLLRLDQSYPELSNAMKPEMGFMQRNIFFRVNPLDRVIDENDVGTEDSDFCTLTNFAVQYRGLRGAVIHLDDRLYSHPKHSTSSKAILLLHEYIYSVLRKSGATDSREVRSIIHDIL